VTEWQRELLRSIQTCNRTAVTNEFDLSSSRRRPRAGTHFFVLSIIIVLFISSSRCDRAARGEGFFFCACTLCMYACVYMYVMIFVCAGEVEARMHVCGVVCVSEYVAEQVNAWYWCLV
jgi:hypothetical protein